MKFAAFLPPSALLRVLSRSLILTPPRYAPQSSSTSSISGFESNFASSEDSLFQPRSRVFICQGQKRRFLPSLLRRDFPQGLSLIFEVILPSRLPNRQVGCSYRPTLLAVFLDLQLPSAPSDLGPRAFRLLASLGSSSRAYATLTFSVKAVHLVASRSSDRYGST